MAVIDNFTVFSGTISAAGVLAGQTVTGADTSVVSTNSYDTTGGAAGHSGGVQIIDLFKGEDLPIAFNITTAFAGATSVAFEVISADDAALTTNVTVLASSGAIVTASLGAGKQIEVAVGAVEPKTLRRYIGTRYTIVGTQSAGAVFAAPRLDVGNVPQPNYRSGYAIL